MLHDTAHEYWEWKRKRDAERAAHAANPDTINKNAQREYNGTLRLTFVKALIASGGLAYYQARIKVAANPRDVYLEMCAELGIEVAELDPA